MKKPGLVRWNFPLYLAGAAILAAAYIFLGLSTHVKSLLEQRLSALNGAPVTIGSAKFSLNGPRIELVGIKFQDAQDVSRTVLTVHRAHMELDMQAFLRNRIVVEDGKAEGLELHPLNFTSAPAAESGSISSASEFLASPDREQLPSDEVWKAVPSVQATTALQAEIDSQVNEWQKQLSSLEKEAEGQSQDLNLNKDNETHLKIVQAQAAKSRAELDQLEAKVRAEGNVLLGKIGTLAELVPHDMTVVRQAVKMPNLEFKNLNSEIGAKVTAPLLGLAENFQERLIPWLLSKEQSRLPRYSRRQGTDFHFEGRLLPPRLWVQKFELNSKATPDGVIGDAAGRIADLSSEPHHYAASFSLQASFPKAEVDNVQLEASIDHKDKIDDRLQLNVTRFPVRGLDFARTPNLRVGIEQAEATLNLELLTTREASIVNLKSQMTKISYRNETQDEALKKVFDDTLGGVMVIEMESSAQGKPQSRLSGPDMHWTYVSNLSDQLRVGLQKTLGEEFAEFNARIKERAELNGIESRKALESELVTKSDAVQQKIAGSKNLLNVAR